MIYRNNLFSKEQKSSYIEQNVRGMTLFRYALFISLFSFSFHLFLKSLDASILSQIIPELLLDSYFSTFSVYNYACFIFFTFKYIMNYKYLTFAEVNDNKWYTFIKAGYSPIRMTLFKMLARLLETLLFYSLGYLFTFILTAFLKYPLTLEYLVPLFVAGLIDMLLLTIVTMAGSLFIQYKSSARYLMAAVSISILILRVTSGYYSVISDRSLMQELISILNPELSFYFIYFLIICSVCFVFIIFGAKRSASYTSFNFYRKDLDFDDQYNIVLDYGDKQKKVKENTYLGQKSNQTFNILINAGMNIIIVFLVVFNLIVLAVTITSINRNWNFLNIYPYVFQSDTMSPVIQFNDLTVFKGVDDMNDFETGDIVLYRDGESVVNIARVYEKNDNQIVVDFDHYPDGTDPYLLQEKINPLSVEGVFVMSSRWLGLLVLFANTMLGRLFMLVLPSVLIFFYQPIIKFLKRLKHG